MSRAFKIFDRGSTGKVSLDEYTETLGELVGNNTEGAIRFLFKIYDENGDGGLEEAELFEALKASTEENGMMFADSELMDLTHALWEDAGMPADGSAKMSLDHLQRQMTSHPGLANGLAER